MMLLILLGFSLSLTLPLLRARQGASAPRLGRARPDSAVGQAAATAPKHTWVLDEVLRLTALIPLHGGRKIADTFNYMYAKHRKMTVGKTYVASVLRSNNEAVFTSRLFRFGLRLLGIRDQHIAPFAPWQNGRVERFFCSFKAMWRLHQQSDTSAEPLQNALDVFRCWYNHVRLHRHLEGMTPAKAWSGHRGNPARPRYFCEWDGLLTGFHFPP